MAERVDDGGVARAVVLVRLPLNVGAAVAGPFQRCVGVGDVQHQAHRSRLWAQALSVRARGTRRRGRARRRRSPARRARCGRRPSRTVRRPPTRRRRRRTRRWRRARSRLTGTAARRAAGERRDGFGRGLVEFGDGGGSVPLMTTPCVRFGRDKLRDSRRARRRAANAGSGWTGRSSPCSTVSGSWLLFMTSLLPAPDSAI